MCCVYVAALKPCGVKRYPYFIIFIIQNKHLNPCMPYHCLVVLRICIADNIACRYSFGTQHCCEQVCMLHTDAFSILQHPVAGFSLAGKRNIVIDIVINKLCHLSNALKSFFIWVCNLSYFVCYNNGIGFFQVLLIIANFIISCWQMLCIIFHICFYLVVYGACWPAPFQKYFLIIELIVKIAPPVGARDIYALHAFLRNEYGKVCAFHAACYYEGAALRYFCCYAFYGFCIKVRTGKSCARQKQNYDKNFFQVHAYN